MKFFSLSVFLTLFLTSCINVQLPDQRVVSYDQNTQDIKSKLNTYKNKVPYQNIVNKSITNVVVGQNNLYGIKVTPKLKIAYDSYLNGDGETGLVALNSILENSKNNKLLWQASFLKIQTLIMLGLGDDALTDIPTCSKYEKLSFNSDLNCISLRGELNVWLEDYEAAKKDAISVLLTIGDWEFPTSYKGPPSNMDTLVATTTAQMRAYTTLAALYNLKENYKESFYWANEGEKRMNAVHYVSNHWLYGQFVNLHLDSYYGRATNLTFLATAKLALGYPQEEVEKDFKTSVDFFEMINYKKGIATVLALKARVYNKLKQHDKCYIAGKEALEYSLENGFLDFVWRIEAIRGDTFINLGALKEAKKAYRRASDTISSLTSSLKSDISKRQFGIGKDDISYRLIKFDIEEKNYPQLFLDLENTRARAFVDMLSLKNTKLNIKNKTLSEIYDIDKSIKKQQLILSAMRNNKTEIRKLTKLMEKRKILEQILQVTTPQLASTISIWSSSLEKTQRNLKDDESIIYFLPYKKDEKISYLKITHDNIKLENTYLSSNMLDNYLNSLEKFLGIENLLSTRALKLSKNSIVKSNSIKKNIDINELINSFNKGLGSTRLFTHKKTYIVQSGNTHFIPFGMIDTSHQISTIPNGSWINYKSTSTVQNNKTLVVANPDFHGKLPQLPGAFEEGKKVASFYGGKFLSNDDATLQNIKNIVGDGINVLHLATHGIFYKDNPLKSSIYLSQGVALTAQDIYKNPIKSNLLVLSACETGLGKSSSGEDMLGLSRSFFLGGTKSILSSLWPIDDIGTKLFMVEFHKYAKDGKYLKGFLEARKTLKNKGVSPAIYGAFVLNGLDK